MSDDTAASLIKLIRKMVVSGHIKIVVLQGWVKSQGQEAQRGPYKQEKEGLRRFTHCDF